LIFINERLVLLTLLSHGVSIKLLFSQEQQIIKDYDDAIPMISLRGQAYE